MPFKLTVALILFLLEISRAHPNCVEPIDGSYFPPKPTIPLSYCDEYANDIDGACCTAETEMTYAGNVVPTILDEGNACYDYIKKLYCTYCSPYAGHFFESEGRPTQRDFTWMCLGFCERFWNTCAQTPLNTNGPSTVGQTLKIPGLVPNSGTVTLGTLYSSMGEYCSLYATDNPVSCYSDNPEEKKVSFDGPGVPYNVYLAFPFLDFSYVPNTRSFRLHITQMMGFNDGSDRIALCFQHGVVVVFQNLQNVRNYQIMLDIQEAVYFDGGGGSEYGMLGIAFHPRFEENGRVIAKYTHTPNTNHVTEYTIDKDFNIVNRNEILSYQTNAVMHHGGQPIFGNDGFLYIPTGDGVNFFDNFQDYNPAPDLGSLLGKILRIDVNGQAPGLNYQIPSDNPFVGQEGVRPEIYAYGFRNPWGFFYDNVRDRFWVGNVGQFSYESIYVVERGRFHGWHTREGFNCYYPTTSMQGYPYTDCVTPDEVLPIIEFPHVYSPEFCDVSSDPPHCAWYIQGSAVIGGWVYRGSKNPSFLGSYIFSNFEPASAAKVYMVQHNEDNPRMITHIFRLDLINENYEYMRIPTLGTDAQGELYIINYDNPNEIWTLEADESASPPTDEPSAPISPPRSPMPSLPPSIIPSTPEIVFPPDFGSGINITVDRIVVLSCILLMLLK